MADIWSIGDMAMLKSGGPIMTIDRVVSDRIVRAIWINSKDESVVCSYEFHVDALEYIDTNPDPEDPDEEDCPEEEIEEIKLVSML